MGFNSPYNTYLYPDLPPGPISNPGLATSVGSAVQWDRTKALALFTAIKNDQPLTVAPAGSGT